MRIGVTSDWHGYVPPEVPDCDVLVVAGDVGLDENFSIGPRTWTLTDYKEWIEAQPMPIVAVAGNHDFHPEVLRALPWIYLEDDSCFIKGLTFWGTPWSNPFGRGWAFNMTEEDQVENLKRCPDDVDVIVSHGPPFERCDLTSSRWGEPKHVGSRALRERMAELPDLKLVACGHIHSAYGKEDIVVGGSLVNEEYRIANKVIVIEV